MASAMEPSRIPAFSAPDFFGGGWRVLHFVPGRRAVLEQARSEQVRAAGRVFAVMLFPLLLALLLALGTRKSDGDVRLITYPLVLICVGLVLLGLLSLQRSVRRVREGVRLELDASAARATGFPEANAGLKDFAARLTDVPLGAVREVKVAVYRGSPNQRLGKATATLTIEAEGVTFSGPSLTAPDPDWELVRDRLLPLACELARIAGV
jgi:hypothetical protein